MPKIHQNEQNSVMLYERLLRERPADRKVVQVKIEDFGPLYEKADADEMDWRAAKGLSSSELRSAAAATGHADASESALDITKAIHDAQQLRNLDESFRERFATEHKIPEMDWEAMQKRVIVVHDHLPADMVREQFEKLSKAAGLNLSVPQSSTGSHAAAVLFAQRTDPQWEGIQETRPCPHRSSNSGRPVLAGVNL